MSNNDNLINKEFLLYTDENGDVKVRVMLINDDLWLTQDLIAELFGKDRTVITRHINNIFTEGELDEKSNVQKMHFPHSDKLIKFYNLDFILAVWYRVNTKQWILFRRRSNEILKKYLLDGYALNQKRIKEIWFENFEKAVALIKKNIETNSLRNKEIKWMLSVITNYAHSWIILQKYDEWTLNTNNLLNKKAEILTYDEAMDAILSMKNELLPKNEVSDAFWEERNDWLKWILDQVYQTFDWQDLYPSIQEKAAALMYFTIKDHPFIDWNKKIWAFLLLIFLGKNNCLQKSDWTKVIDDDTLIALTLLVATSNPSERDMIIALIIHFINC